MYKEKVQRSSEVFPFYSKVSNLIPDLKKFTDTHLHNEIEIIHILSGKMLFHIQNTEVICDVGDIIIINSNIPHSSENIVINTQQMMFQADISVFDIDDNADYSNRYLYRFLNFNQKTYYHLPHSSPINRELGRYLKDIHTEITNKDDSYETYVKGYLNLISAFLKRNNILIEKNNNIENKKIEKIIPIVDYIEKNYSSQITLKSISNATHLNEYYMCRLFKAVTGQTVFNFINYIRIYEAETLLSKTDLSITDIALTVGFPNITRFDEAFKRTTGTTPLKYKKHVHTTTLD